MRRLIVGSAALALALLAGAALLLGDRGPKLEPTPVPAVVAAGGAVVTDGRVVPARSATLSLSGGVIAKILVGEGDKVEDGQLLAQVEAARQEAAVAQAEAGLRKAEAELAQLKAGARAEEVATARAARDGAEASRARLKQPARTEEVAAAEASLAAAKASLAKAKEGPDKDLVVAAEGELSKLKAGASAQEIQEAELAIETAKSALWGAQNERDGACGSAMVPKYQCDVGNAKVAATESALATAKVRLDKLKAPPRAEDLATAEARLERLKSEPNAATIANAEALVEQAQAKLDILKAPPREADVAAAEADVRKAEAQLQLLEAGARPEAVAVAEAGLAAARAVLQEAQAALADTELRAPLKGTVAAVEVKVGEQVAPGVPIIRLADLGDLQVETTDLSETDVVGVGEGSPATLTFDALPGLQLGGKVTRVSPLGQAKQGDITYLVVVRPDQQDPRLRWNMTATVTILPPVSR